MRQALLDRLAGRPEQLSAAASDFEVDDDSAAARAHRSSNSTQPTTPPERPSQRHRTRSIRCSPRAIRRSGDRTCAASAGTSIRLTPAARHGLSHRQLRPHRLHRNLAVDGPGLGYLRDPAFELHPIRAAVPRSRTCGVRWRRRRPRPCISRPVGHSGPLPKLPAGDMPHFRGQLVTGKCRDLRPGPRIL